LELERKEAEQPGLRAARSKCNPDAARRLDNAARDFQKMQADAGELGIPQGMPGRDAIANIQQQPVGGSVTLWVS
jgi:hypothetical protein